MRVLRAVMEGSAIIAVGLTMLTGEHERATAIAAFVVMVEIFLQRKD